MVKKAKGNPGKWKLNLILLSFLLSFGAIIVRLFSIQVVNHGKYEALALEQYRDLREIPPKRGDILSSDGYVLAGTQIKYLLYVEPQNVKNVDGLTTDLAKVISDFKAKDAGKEDYDKILLTYHDAIHSALNSGLLWVAIERNFSSEEKTKIEELKLEGVGFEDEPVRFYPAGTLAAHVLGFVASSEKGEKTGYFGVEGNLNEKLKGKYGRVVEEMDASGVPILAGKYRKVEPIDGGNIVLTLNRAVQYIVEKKLREGVEKYDAISGSVIVMEPYTGRIIAMANYPTYMPGDLSEPEVKDGEKEPPRRKTVEKRNLCISQTYEPGSVTKPVTISSAVDLGLITPQTTFEDKGPVWYSDYVIDNWDGKHYGIQNIVQLLQKSNNIGAAWVGHQVGAKNLYRYMKDFGLGEETGVELEGEDSGVVRDYKAWTDIDLASASFGQSISATPLQVLNAFNVIANGGYLLQPRVISQIIDKNKTTEIPSKSLKRVISKNTSQTMVDMLEKAAEGGEAKFYVLKEYKIAGKTGTAQISEKGKYVQDRTNATFAGFLSQSRKFSMIVKLEETRTSLYASETAAPLWMDIASELIKFYGIAPDKSVTSQL